MSDFENFEILHIPLPIQTANGSTYITGKGAITLRHLNVQKNVVETTINNVFFCDNLTCKGTSRVSLSKSGELISTKSSISICIVFSLFLASSVCIMWYDAFYSI